ncbi:hypothetical protein M569_16068 [Genlisea aurea]|uniref:Uncharacterized protein n=1 Tax=Genlisea aurea TaxID=192259 RepID=S8DH86_9LAMI|nr:hypothetical protein M569_16068 [Genlisea aurea]
MLQGFSTVDGFAEITENLADMIRFVANEPSVGLFYVQHHVRNAAPNLVALKNTVADGSRLASLHTQDMEDSISAVRSMKESGLSAVDEIIKDIDDSISIISSSNRGSSLSRSSSSSGFLGRSISWSPAAAFWGLGGGHQEVKKKTTKKKNSGGYLSSGFFKTTSTADSGESSWKEEAELDLPLPMSAEADEEESQLHTSLSQQQLISLYDDFRADKEAQLEQWLGSEDLNKAS